MKTKTVTTDSHTGLDYFDYILGGEDFPDSSVTFLTGTPGAGKTTMMLMLADELHARSAQVVFNTTEESLYQIKMTADRLNLQSGFGLSGESNVLKLLKNCDKLRKATPTKPFFLIVESTIDIEILSQLTSYAKATMCNVLIIAQYWGKLKSPTTSDMLYMGLCENKVNELVDLRLHLSVWPRQGDINFLRKLNILKSYSISRLGFVYESQLQCECIYLCLDRLGMNSHPWMVDRQYNRFLESPYHRRCFPYGCDPCI